MTTSDKKKNRRSKKERYDEGKKIISRQTDKVRYRKDEFSDHKEPSEKEKDIIQRKS